MSKKATVSKLETAVATASAEFLAIDAELEAAQNEVDLLKEKWDEANEKLEQAEIAREAGNAPSNPPTNPPKEATIMAKEATVKQRHESRTAILGTAAPPKPSAMWSVGEVQRPDASGPLYAPVRVVNNEFVEHGMTPSHDRPTMERAVAQLNLTGAEEAALRKVEPAHGTPLHKASLSTHVTAIVGKSREWNIVTESGNILERFAGTKYAAQKRATQLHSSRVVSLISLALNTTWRAISADVESSCKRTGEKLVNALVYETLLDCEYLEMYGPGYRKDQLILDAIREYRELPYEEQLRIVRKTMGKVV